MKQTGLIHIYEGDGKGKTTAAVGLCVRFAGNGGKAVFTQFLKKNDSGELAILEQIEQIHVIRCEKSFGFTFQMTEEEKKEACAYYSHHLMRVLNQAEEQEAGLLVLDEAAAVYEHGLVNREVLLEFLKKKPEYMEVVLTGRNPAPELLKLADYVTYMEKRKHPYDKGIGARRGIEQ